MTIIRASSARQITDKHISADIEGREIYKRVMERIDAAIKENAAAGESHADPVFYDETETDLTPHVRAYILRQLREIGYKTTKNDPYLRIEW